MILTSLSIAPSLFESQTGWSIKPHGACKGDACVPLPASVYDVDQQLDVRLMAERLGMPLVQAHDMPLWALGPESASNGRTLASAQAPDLILPDAAGNEFRLSSLRGQKVLLVTWASWCGCRTDLPLWQDIRARLHPQGLEIVTVALDTDGIEAARPWIERARPEHPSLIDVGHTVDALFGVVNVPNGVWIDEHGVIVRPAEPAWPGRTMVSQWKEDGLSAHQLEMLKEVRNIRFETEEYLQMLEDWVTHGSASQYALAPQDVIDQSQPRTPATAQAAAHFELGQHLHRQGNHPAAIVHWREAHRLQPDNWTYKRQAWDIEDPGTQGKTAAYDSHWLADVQAVGASNYYPKIRR